MPREPVATERAPAAIGPYSQAVRAGGSVYLSGQIPLDPATGAHGLRIRADRGGRALGGDGFTGHGAPRRRGSEEPRL